MNATCKAFVSPFVSEDFGASAATTYLRMGKPFECQVTAYVLSETRMIYYETEKSRPFIYSWGFDPSLHPSSKAVLQEVIHKVKQRAEFINKIKREQKHVDFTTVELQFVIDPVTQSQAALIQELARNARRWYVSLQIAFDSIDEIPVGLIRSELDSITFCLDNSDPRENQWFEREHQRYQCLRRTIPKMKSKIVNIKRLGSHDVLVGNLNEKFKITYEKDWDHAASD